MIRYTGESAWREPLERGRRHYGWQRSWLIFGRYVSITRHGEAARRAHRRLMFEPVPFEDA